MNRIDALTYAFNDAARPANEREAALAALRNLALDGSDEAERRQSQTALNSLEGNHPETAADAELENQLLFQYHAATLGDVQHHDLHAFCSGLRFSAAAQNLYMKWLSVSPVAQSKMTGMKKHLRSHMLAGYDAMLKRYKEALDGGGDMNAANLEAWKFYRDWVDSGVTPEELKPHFRQLIAALAARCEGQHDRQS